jgi:hypothetical protein
VRGVRRLRVLALLLGGLVAVGVWLVGSASSAPASHGWTRAGVGAVSQPAPVGGKFVVYAQHKGSLEVVALNATDGSTAWTASASPSAVTAGVAAELAVRAGSVFYLQGVGSPGAGLARVVARSAASGKLIWQTAPGTFETWPEICPDETSAVCANGVVGGVGSGQLRFSAASGEVLSVVQMGSASFPGRELGPDLFDPGGRSPERLLAVNKGRRAWVRKLSSIFTLPHATTDGGWEFDRFGSRFVGSVGRRPKVKNGTATVELAPTMTAGFSSATGRVEWRASGFYACGQPLPCPGRSEAGYSSPSSYTPASVGIRLIGRGTETGPINGGKPTVSRDAAVSIQGFNPVSGKAEWSFNAGRNIPLLTLRGALPQVGATSIVLKTGSGSVALDLRTGKTSHLRATSRAWCQRTILYHLAHAAYYGGRRGLYVGGESLFPCTLGARRVATPAKLPGLVRLIGAGTDGITAWVDAGAVHGRPS